MADSKTFEVETSLTLDYRKERWGLERIVLDGISNHLPADSGGQHTQVRLKQGGVWVELKNANPAAQTEEVMFDDDGKGYTSQKLSTLRSTKGADVFSVGQFGEGLKLVAAAALRHDLQLQYRSRNWWATPFKKPETDDGDNYDRLCFRVTENGDTLDGSRTIFFNPSAELLTEIFKLPTKVLALNHTYRELHNERDNYNYLGLDFGQYIIQLQQPELLIPLKLAGESAFDLSGFKLKQRYHSRIIDLGRDDTDEKAIFVKGVLIQKSKSLFSYDLGIEDITPDRIYANREVILNEMERLLKGCTNEEVIVAVLKAAENPDANYDEFHALNKFRKQKPELPFEKILSGLDEGFPIKPSFSPENHHWVRTFKALYGETAVLADDDSTINNDAEILGFKPVRLHFILKNYLAELGIERAHIIATGIKEYKWIDLSDLTTDELAIYNLIPQLNQAAFGESGAIPLEKVRIYQGMYFASGREAESDLGVTITEKDGSSYIGIKRSLLSNQEDFAATYFHEAGHYLTKQPDHTRGHADFGYEHMARLALEKIVLGK